MVYGRGGGSVGTQRATSPRGPGRDLYFDDSASNQALVELRRFLVGFIETFEPNTPQIWHEGVPSEEFKALDGQTHEHDGVNP